MDESSLSGGVNLGKECSGVGTSSSKLGGPDPGKEVRPRNKPVAEGGLLDDGTVRINVWSGPRCLSTALMYSFAQRPDTVVYDEPLYAHFLSTHPEDETWRPYRDQVLAEQMSDGNRWIREVALGPTPKPVVYMKHMAKQVRGLDLSFLSKCRNVIQIRSPLKMLPSWDKNCNVTLKEVGILDMLQLYSNIRLCGQEPIIIDADLLRCNPEGVLRELSHSLDIPYHPEQLQWEAGPKTYDGCWAYLWYGSVHQTTRFECSARYARFDPAQSTLLEECMPIYDFLRSKAFTGHGKLGRVRRPLPPPPSSPACHQDNPVASPEPTSSLDSSSEAAANGAGGVARELEGLAIDPAGEGAGQGEGGGEGGTAAEMHGRSLKPGEAAALNESILVWIGGHLLPRGMAKVSVFDSSVQGGDAVWEGLRVYKNKIFMLDRHLRRLIDSAKALAFKGIPSEGEVKSALFSTLAANDMTNEVHVRLTLTRGLKITSSMNPRFNMYGCTLIVLPEYKPVGGPTTYDNDTGVRLITAAYRRMPPQCLDSRIHHNNMLNNILPKIQANAAGAADAMMLDIEGFVSETNACNVFMVKGGILVTPSTGSCLPGITRGVVLELAKTMQIPLEERRVTLVEFHSADEVFTTGTMGELTPVVDIDGRCIGNGKIGPVTARLQRAYHEMSLCPDKGCPLPKFH